MMPMKSPLVVSLIIVGALVQHGCKSLESGALEAFARLFSCPEDRVTVTPRNDIDPVALLGSEPISDDKAAEEVRRDPGRLAKWRQDREADRRTETKEHSRYRAFEVAGCDHSVLMLCVHPRSNDPGDSPDTVISSRVNCTVAGAPVP
jgi:hypothetical protein